MSGTKVRRIIVSACSVALLGGCTLLGPGREQETIEALRTQESSRRLKALSELDGRVTPAMREPLEKIIRTDTNPTIRAMAAEALGELGMGESVEELRLSARRDSSWIVRRRALGSLARIVGKDVQGDLRYALNHDQQDAVRVEAVKLAGDHLQGEALANVLLMGLEDESGAVRLTACLELSRATGENIPPGDYERWKEAAGEL